MDTLEKLYREWVGQPGVTVQARFSDVLQLLHISGLNVMASTDCTAVDQGIDSGPS